MNAEVKVPEGYMMNREGGFTPLTAVKPQDKLEDELVRGLVADARALRDKLKAFKARGLSEAAGFRAMVAQEYGAKKGGAKGNMTLSAYDGSAQVSVQVGEHISFGAELSAAKELIDGCIMRWSEGANDNLRAIVDQAFQVNKQGKIDTQRVLNLRKLEITGPDGGRDDDWEQAMKAISDAVRVTGSRTYLRFYEVDADGQSQAISLDLAAL